MHETDTTRAADHDSPWKMALESYSQEFLDLLFPAIHEQVDWSKGYSFLDKELQQITADASSGRRYADKLIKVYARDGSETWVLIHVEVQGEPEVDFAKRMYRYNYRIQDKYDKDVISLAVLTDTHKNFRPSCYEFTLGGCRILFEFPMVKLLDWQDRLDELHHSDNVFALIVAAQLHAKLNKQPAQKFDAKVRLTRLLYQRGYEKVQVIELLRLIDWMITLPHNLEIQCKQIVDQIEEEQKMAYMTSMERIAMQEGRLEGKLEAAQTMVRDFGISVKDAATKLKVPLDDLVDYLKKHEQPKQ